MEERTDQVSGWLVCGGMKSVNMVRLENVYRLVRENVNQYLHPL